MSASCGGRVGEGILPKALGLWVGRKEERQSKQRDQ